MAARQNSENLLREREANYRLLFENNPLPLWVYDVETLAFIAVNEAAVRAYQYSREEFLAMTIKDIRPAEDIPALLKSIPDSPGDLDAAGIWRHRKKDGALIDVEITSHPLKFAGRNAEIVLANDVTERRRTEGLLRQNEARLQTIVESLTEGLVVSDLHGQLLHFNRAAREMHGFTSLEESLRHLNEFGNIFELTAVDGDVMTIAQWPLARVLRGEEVRNLEVVIRRFDQQWKRTFNYGGTLVKDEGGQPILAVVSMSDITRRKQSEDDLRIAHRRLEQAFAELQERLLSWRT